MNMSRFTFIVSLTFLLWMPPVCSADISTLGTRPYYVRPQPSTIVTQPVDEAVHFEVLMGKTTIRCEVDIQPIVSGWWAHIYWRHNGSTVNSSWPTGTSIDTNFWNFSVLHTPFPGSYQCVVDDGSFVLVSRVAQITLLLIYPDPNPPLWHSVEACPGEMVHLPCQPVTSDYQVQVFWRRNDLVMQMSEQQHIILQPNGPGDLVIYKFSHKDVGNYSCSTFYNQIITGYSVTQSNGSCTNWSDIHVLASRAYIQQGENLFLVCLARLSNITFSWFHEGKPLNSSKGVLHISNSSEATLGNYTCRATAEDASAVTSASVVVRRFENVSVTAQPLDRWLSYNKSGFVDHSITLTCAATGSPPVVTTWVHNGRTIQNTQSIVIHSGANATQVVGMYQCFVKNLHSEARQAFRIKLYRKPNPPGIVTQHVISSDKYTMLNLTWLPAEHILDRQAVQYLRVNGGTPDLGQRLASNVSSTGLSLKQHFTYQFYIEASTTDGVPESQWFLFSSKGNASKPFNCCSPTLIGNGSIQNYSCDPEYIGMNNTVRCAFQWTLPPDCKDAPKSTVSIFCPNDIKRQKTVEYPSGTTVNASITHIPCNTNCKVSVSTSAWDTSFSNTVTCSDNANQTFKSAGVAPSHPAVIGDWKRSCTGKDVMLSVYIPSQMCGDPEWYCVHYSNGCSSWQPLGKGQNISLNVSLPNYLQWRPTSLSIEYKNSRGRSPLSNTVQVPGITPDDVQNCVNYSCQQMSDRIVCPLTFPSHWVSKENVQFKDVTFTMLDCNVIRHQTEIECSLEMEGCHSVGNHTVSADTTVYGSFADTCHTHTYCIIAHVDMKTQEPVYLNRTASCATDCSKESKTCSASPSSPSNSAPTTAAMSSQDTSYITYILIAGLILLVIILLVIMGVIAGYCVGRKKQNNEMLESLRTMSSLQESNFGNSAESRNESLQDGNQYHLQSTVHPDDTTQICPVNCSQTDLTSQWVEDQQRLADESEESDVDESSPLLSTDPTSMGNSATISPRPNHPDGSSQIKYLQSPEWTGYHVGKLMTSNIMQQQPSQVSGPRQTYVELQSCRTRTENSSPNQTSTSFAGASGQLPFSSSSPYIPDPMLLNRGAKRCSRPHSSLEDDEESFGHSLTTASDFCVQPSISPPITTCATGYISMPHPAAAVEDIHNHSTKDVGSQEVDTVKPDMLEPPENPPELALAWSPPSLYGVSSLNPLSDS